MSESIIRGSTAAELAHHEVEWWKAHHRKDNEGMLQHMSAQLVIMSGAQLKKLSIEEARVAVQMKVAATKWHDEAEHFEDNHVPNNAGYYWNKTEECLLKHFEMIVEE